MKAKHLLFLLAALVTMGSKVEASHLMGGEITWECQPNGQYIFTLRVYRDCNGIGIFVCTDDQHIELLLVAQYDPVQFYWTNGYFPTVWF